MRCTAGGTGANCCFCWKLSISSRGTNRRSRFGNARAPPAASNPLTWSIWVWVKATVRICSLATPASASADSSKPSVGSHASAAPVSIRMGPFLVGDEGNALTESRNFPAHHCNLLGQRSAERLAVLLAQPARVACRHSHLAVRRQPRHPGCRRTKFAPDPTRVIHCSTYLGGPPARRPAKLNFSDTGRRVSDKGCIACSPAMIATCL